jgi:predicted DNA-binding protein
MKSISFRIPRELAEELTAVCRRKGISKAQYTREALDKALRKIKISAK